MHKIDKEKMREIILELLEEENLNDPAKLVEMLRLAHEKSIIYKYFSELTEQQSTPVETIEEDIQPTTNKETGIKSTIDFVPEKVEKINDSPPELQPDIEKIENISPEKQPDVEETQEKNTEIQAEKEIVQELTQESSPDEPENLSFQERLQRILDNAQQIGKENPEEASTTSTGTSSDNSAGKDETQTKKTDTGTENIPEKTSADSNHSTGTSAPALTPDKTDPPAASFEEEFKDAISADYAAELFDRSTPAGEQTKTLNDRLSSNQLIIGLNDRIAFVKHLFKGDLNAFNLAIKHLQNCPTQEQAESFILGELKTKYEWSEKNLPYEERFINTVMRKFG